ncbi:MAG: discoidin domain-containing protein [Acidobacteria bacterium]|nr:discoidin domain-containing protein [Acidobacteriota bacterium]
MTRNFTKHRFFILCSALALTMVLASGAVGQWVTPLNRIGVNPMRPSEFIDTVTRKAFFPEGNNYISQSLCGVACEFNLYAYDSAKAEAILAQMQHDGYNIVRIFVQFAARPNADAGPYWGVGGSSQTQSADLSPEYMANLTDFLIRANRHRIYVLPVLTYTPYTAYYSAIVNRPEPNIGGFNRFYLGSGAIEAKKQYVRKFVSAIRPELRSTIFAYELENEVVVMANEPPFSLTSGLVKTANGLTYDMANDASRQQCMDANLVYWANAVAAAIRENDAQAMVSASVFTYAAAGNQMLDGVRMRSGSPWPRFPARPKVFNVWARGLSFQDVHLYPTSSSYSIDADLKSSAVDSKTKNQPLVMGEFGASDQVYSTVYTAAGALQNHRNKAYDLWSFAGSLLWTWDAARGADNRIYPASEAGGAINGALAPLSRVTASSSIAPTYPFLAADGNAATAWNAGGFAPQWIQLDLGRNRLVSRINLTVAQNPAGQTSHVLEGRLAGATVWTNITTLTSFTQNGQQLSYALPIARTFRFLRVRTTLSPSWVAWHEISVE